VSARAKEGQLEHFGKLLKWLVGAAGIEPATTCSQGRCGKAAAGEVEPARPSAMVAESDGPNRVAAELEA